MTIEIWRACATSPACWEHCRTRETLLTSLRDVAGVKSNGKRREIEARGGAVARCACASARSRDFDISPRSRPSTAGQSASAHRAGSARYSRACRATEPPPSDLFCQCGPGRWPLVPDLAEILKEKDAEPDRLAIVFAKNEFRGRARAAARGASPAEIRGVLAAREVRDGSHHVAFGYRRASYLLPVFSWRCGEGIGERAGVHPRAHSRSLA